MPPARVHRLALSSGRSIPCIGFGTGTAWFRRSEDRNSDTRPLNEETVQGVRAALAAGWDHVDAAEMYGTEREVGVALREHLQGAGGEAQAREDLFVTSKVWQSVRNVKQAAADSLRRLGLDYMDLYLIHAPFLPEGVELQTVWRGMEELVDAGICRDIGVSNFRVPDLERLRGARIQPVINQIEANPYLQQPELKSYCADRGIIVEAYSPLMPITAKKGGPLDPVVQEIAAARGVTPGEVLLRWSLQSGYLPVTTSKNPDRLRQFLRCAARPPSEHASGTEGPLALTPAEVDRIASVGSELTHRSFWTKDFESSSQ